MSFEKYYRLTADIEEEGLRRVEALDESDPLFEEKLGEIDKWLQEQNRPFLYLIS